MTEPLPTGATIGILGGGQLGRMLSVAASRLGFVCHIFEFCLFHRVHMNSFFTSQLIYFNDFSKTKKRL